ncbi:MAG: hypothetical protein KKA32_08600 [Actinobacteria bacterium]|nr:hypothetical protein [Actinomycetota bacterium]
MGINYCHIGAGKLGLGLAYPMFHPVAGRSAIVQRPAASGQSDSQRRNQVLDQREAYYVDDGRQRIEVPVLDFRVLDPVTSPRRVAEVIAGADIVSVATGTDVREYWPALRLADAMKSEPCALLAFDNSRRASSHIIRSAERSLDYRFTKLVPCDMVVDRICTNVRVVEDQVVVEAEAFLDVTIQATDSCGQLLSHLLRDQANVRIVQSDDLFDAYEKRKAWLMNAAHYAFAAFGLQKSPLFTVDSAAKDTEILEAVRRTQNEFTLALLLWMEERGLPEDGDVSKPALIRYAADVRARVASGPTESADRIFNGLLEYSQQGKLHSDIVERMIEDTDQLLKEHLAKVGHHRGRGAKRPIMVARILRGWHREPELQFYRQKLAARLNSHMAALVTRIGLVSFFEKARARIHEPLNLLIEHLKGTPEEEIRGYPMYSTAALLAVENAVLYYVRRAELNITNGSSDGI